jgi:hypothetical protein
LPRYPRIVVVDFDGEMRSSHRSRNSETVEVSVVTIPQLRSRTNSARAESA